MTIDDYIQQRNELQLIAEDTCSYSSIDCADEMWVRLGVANRHIERVLTGQLPLTPGLEEEIQRCLDDAKHWLTMKKLITHYVNRTGYTQ